VLAVDSGLADLFGVQPQEMYEPGMFERLSPDQEREKPLLEEMLAGERDCYRLTKQYVRRDGTSLTGTVNVKLLRDEAGQPKTAFGVVVVECDHDLRELLEQRQLLAEAIADTETRIARAALQITEEEGLTRRQVARRYGVGLSTVQGWIDRARALR
jgi:PAS domain S-box-containing protein